MPIKYGCNFAQKLQQVTNGATKTSYRKTILYNSAIVRVFGFGKRAYYFGLNSSKGIKGSQSV